MCAQLIGASFSFLLPDAIQLSLNAKPFWSILGKLQYSRREDSLILPSSFGTQWLSAFVKCKWEGCVVPSLLAHPQWHYSILSTKGSFVKDLPSATFKWLTKDTDLLSGLSCSWKGTIKPIQSNSLLSAKSTKQSLEDAPMVMNHPVSLGERMVKGNVPLCVPVFHCLIIQTVPVLLSNHSFRRKIPLEVQPEHPSLSF